MVVIRPAVVGEISQLAEIGLSAWQRGIRPLVSPATANRVALSNPFLPFLREATEQILVGEVDGRPAGIGACEHGNDYITDVWVAPTFEGLGVGTTLIKALEKQIVARGYDQSRISVAAQNERALKLYVHLGYQENHRAAKFDPILETALEKINLIKQLG